MRIYRTHHLDHGGIGSSGFTWHTSKRAAHKARVASGGDSYVEPVDVTLTRRGLLRLLSRVASHPDNG